MNMKKVLSGLGGAILILGTLTGIILMLIKVKTGAYTEGFSVVNISIGFAIIISSITTFFVCEWLNQVLENSKQQTILLKEQLYLLSQVKNKLYEK